MYKQNYPPPIQSHTHLYDYKFCYGDPVIVIDTNQFGYVFQYNYDDMYELHYYVQFLIKSYPRWMFWKDDDLNYVLYSADELKLNSLVGTLTVNGNVEYK